MNTSAICLRSMLLAWKSPSAMPDYIFSQGLLRAGLVIIKRYAYSPLPAFMASPRRITYDKLIIDGGCMKFVLVRLSRAVTTAQQHRTHHFSRVSRYCSRHARNVQYCRFALSATPPPIIGHCPIGHHLYEFHERKIGDGEVIIILAF